MTHKAISELRPNPISEKLYGKITEDPNFITLKQSIATDKVREPIVITESGFIISGVRRYYAALELEMKTIPVIISDVNENEIDELMVMIHQLHRNKTPVQIFKEIEAINKRYNLKIKGRPRLGDTQKTKARKQRNKLLSVVSKTTNNRLQSAKEILLKIYGDDKKVLDIMTGLEKKGLNPSAILQNAKKILADHIKNKKGDEKNKQSDKFKIIKHDSRMEFPQNVIKDKSVSCIITSPAYPFSIRDYDTGENQIGHEKTLAKYINSLVKVFRNCKRVLKETGSLFINISDSIQNGSLQNVPAKLAEALKEDGWIYNSNIIWLRVNPTFQNNKRPVPSYEHILHFTLNKEFNYYTDWIEGDIINDRMYYGDMGKQVRLRDFWDGRNHIVRSPVANNQKISDYLLTEGYFLTHSATFPVEVPLAIVSSVCKRGEDHIILDCFNGLATTGIAALNLGAYYIGVDNNPEYIEQSEARLKKFIDDKEKREKEDEELKQEHSVQRVVEKKRKGKVLSLEYGEKISNESTIKEKKLKPAA